MCSIRIAVLFSLHHMCASESVYVLVKAGYMNGFSYVAGCCFFHAVPLRVSVH